MAGKTTFMALVAGSAVSLGLAVAPTSALAGGNGCNCTPPPPPPSPPPCNCTPPPGHNIVIPGVNVFVAPSVIVTVNAQAQAQAASVANAATFVNGGGGGGTYLAPAATGLIQGLNVEGMGRRASYEATRTLYKKVVIQAFCFDDRDVPHPASQVRPDRDIDDLYEGELYRCIAGTHMQVTIADWKEHVSFEGGQTLACRKGEALYHFPGGAGFAGKIECRAQKPARDCNERSLLRRFGAGIKVLSIMVTEKYTAYREEKSSTALGMTLDGGVGGVAY